MNLYLLITLTLCTSFCVLSCSDSNDTSISDSIAEKQLLKSDTIMTFNTKDDLSMLIRNSMATLETKSLEEGNVNMSLAKGQSMYAKIITWRI